MRPRTRDSRRNNVLLFLGLLIISVTAAVYITVMRAWLSGKPALSKGAAKPAVRPDTEGLVRAQRYFRDNYLDPRAHLRLSEALFKAARPVDAFYVMQHARRLFGDGPFRRAHSYVVLFEERHFLGVEEWDPSPENEQRLRERLESEPHNPALIEYLARVSQARGDAGQARALVERGLAAQPGERGLRLLRARLIVPDDALRGVTEYAQLVNAAPGSWEAREALEDLGRLAQGREDGPLGEQARLAREGLEELLKARPEEPGIFATLGMALWARGDRAAARALVDENRNRRRPQPGAARLEGVLALQENLPDKALRHFTEAWEADPSDVYSAARLAQLYHRQQNQPEAALPFYIALYRRDPGASDGEPVELIVRRILDERRKTLLRSVGPEGLGRFLRSDDASLRAEACARAAELGDARWIDAIGDLLDDDTEPVRHNADYALYRLALAQPEAVSVRREKWLDPTRPLGKARALDLFAELDPQQTFPLATRALYDANPGLRYLVKTLVLDPHYGHLPEGRKAADEYLRHESHPTALQLLKRAPGGAR